MAMSPLRRAIRARARPRIRMLHERLRAWGRLSAW